MTSECIYWEHINNGFFFLSLPESSGGETPQDENSQLGWEEQGGFSGPDPQDPCEDSASLHRIQSLAEAEKLFDELTQEKQQVRVQRHVTICFFIKSVYVCKWNTGVFLKMM